MDIKGIAFRSYQDSWNLQDGMIGVAAHEIGHFLGNVEECGNVENIKLIDNISSRLDAPVTYSGSDVRNYGAANQKGGNIMNNLNNYKEGTARAKHFWLVAGKANQRKDLDGCKAVKKDEKCGN